MYLPFPAKPAVPLADDGLRPATRALDAGLRPDPVTGAIAPNI